MNPPSLRFKTLLATTSAGVMVALLMIGVAGLFAVVGPSVVPPLPTCLENVRGEICFLESHSTSPFTSRLSTEADDTFL